MSLIVTNIDGVLADSERRWRTAFREVYGKARKIDMAKAMRGLSPLLTEEQEMQFLSVFMSDKFMHLDRPIPHASRVLRKAVKKGYSVVYLTKRVDSMRAATLQWLGKHKFPLDGPNVHLFMKEGVNSSDSEFLKSRISEIMEMGDVAFGVANSLDSVVVYSECGIKPVILETGRDPAKQLNVSLENIVKVSSWKEVGKMLGLGEAEKQAAIQVKTAGAAVAEYKNENP